MAKSKKRAELTPEETAKLNEAIQTLHNYCAEGYCEDCPFRKEKQPLYGTLCKFGSFYPELWEDVNIKEDV